MCPLNRSSPIFILRFINVGRYKKAPTLNEAVSIVKRYNLLSTRVMKDLFPDVEIVEK